ncbi:PHP domain-containing protein [Vallitalea guaymasensis]|uniref:PHP domain-containing protein n=1 Tax=Vallitalea guaymasensis TaxID=1185412 RepID=UPI0023547226|nr:PHP domain-containing protein [Vallitalea guaymasensis]
MKEELRFFEVTPKIILADTTAEIEIKPLAKYATFDSDTDIEVAYYPLEHFSTIGEYNYQEKYMVRAKDGVIQLTQHFIGEQEHIIKITDTATKKSYTFNFYSVRADLFDRIPYKGDLHMHSHHSDGKESPGFVTASCRKIGFDFMALTDHRKYYPSIECQETYKDIDLDILIARGEEVHPENNNVHIINFGGDFSVNEYMQDNKDEYYKEVKKIEKTIDLDDEHAKYECASSMWCFDKIREGGGLSIFCHPYWLIDSGYYISNSVIDFMYDNQPYDANEVVGGYHPFEFSSNTLQIARYYEERAKGKKVPIVGVSDAHGCEDKDLFGWFYTIVFAPSNEQPDLIKSIKDLYSVGVEFPAGETVRPVGPFRLVKYALFLIREVFPLHDELCYEEGQLMLKYISGDENAKVRLNSLKGQVSNLYNKLFSK